MVRLATLSITNKALEIGIEIMTNQEIAYKIYENKTNLNGWGNIVIFSDLDRADQIVVSRIINNLIRQDFY